MFARIREIAGKRVRMMGDESAQFCMFWLVDEHTFVSGESMVEKWLQKNERKNIFIVLCEINDWNRELSPWEYESAEIFSVDAQQTLSWLKNKALPTVKQQMGNREEIIFALGGYSLAGLFALWCAYQTEAFDVIAAVSPSVWYPRWDAYMQTHRLMAKKVYLSLGKKEADTKNEAFQKVAQRIKQQYELTSMQLGESCCILEWNEGKHFTEVEQRMEKALLWLWDAWQKEAILELLKKNRTT